MKLEQILLVLQALECELHQPNARRDAARLEKLMHPDFQEFGRSGRSYTRAEILTLLLAETGPQVDVHAQDFRLLALTDKVYLLTYRSAHISSIGLLERHTNRASIWRLEPEGWQMVFHPGTATDAIFL